MGSMPPNRDHDLFWPSLALGSVLELLLGSATELVVTSCHIKSILCCISQSDGRNGLCCCTEKEKLTLQNDNAFYFQSTHEAPTYGAFSPFQFESNAK